MLHHLWLELNHKKKSILLHFHLSKLKKLEELQVRKTKEKRIKVEIKNDSKY